MLPVLLACTCFQAIASFYMVTIHWYCNQLPGPWRCSCWTSLDATGAGSGQKGSAFKREATSRTGIAYVKVIAKK
jgi:hypothetical protein